MKYTLFLFNFCVGKGALLPMIQSVLIGIRGVEATANYIKISLIFQDQKSY
ncbi:hypothetical protein HGP29_12370 [Flammeovirga sp. SR4]|uniref:Uncharacterized protein n=1 Tax=Flammeovirga agarivorans TaxID=2726742 RepID=A0A7X8XW86_9BACT|nr:hypothetical protein [Flammeovirga agarivorans]